MAHKNQLPQIHYSYSGNKTSAVMYYKGRAFKASAKCDPKHKFSYKTGERIARERATSKFYASRRRKLREDAENYDREI